MPSVFISYRRADSMEATGRIYDRLVDYLGSECVFRDIDSIPLGISFPELLQKTISHTDAVLVIIGPTWLSLVGTSGQPRITEPTDYVRMEVEVALNRNVPVIPILVSYTTLPSPEELPQSIRELAYRNYYSVRPDPDFHRDVDILCQKLQEILRLPDRPVRTSLFVQQEVESLQQKNQILEAQLELQHELNRIDREWGDERENHKVQYGEKTAAQIPTLFSTVFIAIGSIVVMFVGLGMMGGSGFADFPPEWFRVVWVLAGIGAPIYYVYRYAAYVKARNDFQRRRDTARRQFENRVKTIQKH